MKGIKVIYNPKAGKQLMEQKVNLLKNKLKESLEVNVEIFATSNKFDAKKEAIKSCSDEFNLIVACGGDGTINEVINGIMNSEKKKPLAIFAAGTVNDYANYWNIPNTVNGFVEMIKNFNKKKVDIGLAGDRYFINVAACGAFTDVACKVPTKYKAAIGKYAYYINGLKEIPKEMFKFKKITFCVNGEKKEINTKLFLMTNSSDVGGVKKIAPLAQTDDGLLDLIIFEDINIHDSFNIMFKYLKSDHINHPKIHYYKVEHVKIDSDEENMIVDVDGEQGGKLPMEFRVVKHGLEILIP